MNTAIKQVTRSLRDRRLAQGISQRELSTRTGVPQSQISKIENNTVDLRISSLLTLAYALDLDMVLVPRQAVPAVKTILEQVISSAASEVSQRPRPLYSLKESSDD